MKLNKQIQYGILLTLYISRGGRVTFESARLGLGLTKYRLKRVVAVLKSSNVVHGIRGRNGGLELVGNPTVKDVLKALRADKFLTPTQKTHYRMGMPEHRAFSMLVSSFELSMSPHVNKPIRSVMKDLIDSEMKYMNKKETMRGLSQ